MSSVNLRSGRRLALLLPVVAGVVLLLVTRLTGGTTSGTAIVPAGHDLLETDPSQTYQDLNLPPDFFGPGCEPFAGRVFLRGDPIGTFMGFGGLGPTDTIVRRLADAPAPEATIPIEIVALNLVSVEPIIVTCGGLGQQWELRAQIFEGPNPPQIPGSMTIRHEFPDGGTFDALLPVMPLLTFTRVDGPGVIGPFPPPGGPINFQSTNVPWCHTANPLDIPPGNLVIERPPLTSNFFPGITCPEVGGQRIKEYFGEQALLAAHGVRPAEVPAEVTPTPSQTPTATATATRVPEEPTDTATPSPTATATAPPSDHHDDEVVGFLGPAQPAPRLRPAAAPGRSALQDASGAGEEQHGARRHGGRLHQHRERCSWVWGDGRRPARAHRPARRRPEDRLVPGQLPVRGQRRDSKRHHAGGQGQAPGRCRQRPGQRREGNVHRRLCYRSLERVSAGFNGAAG